MMHKFFNKYKNITVQLENLNLYLQYYMQYK
jgi:hypothetical protein